MKSTYVSNVFHTAHVTNAMIRAGFETDLIGRMTFSQSTVRRVSSVGMLEGVGALMARRTKPDCSGVAAGKSLGPLELIPAVVAQTSFKLAPWQFKLVTHALSKRVNQLLSQVDLLQFTEGLGHVALRHRDAGVTICERRNLHHEEFESDLECHLGFPFKRTLQPLRSYMEEECETATLILVYSEVAKESYVNRGVDPDRIVVVPLGLNFPLSMEQQDRPPRDPTSFVYVGRGDAFKGLDVAVAAIELLGEPYNLTVAGRMPKEVLSWLSKRRGVEYVGILSRSSLWDLFSSSSVFLSPSVESFGLAALEAAAHGMFVVCRETTGIAEYLRNDACLVVAGRDVARWSDACRAAADMAQMAEAEELRLINEAAARQLSIANAEDRLADLYSRLFEIR